MITITIVPQTQAQMAVVTKLLKDYPASTDQDTETPEAAPPKTAPRASSAKASPAPAQAVKDVEASKDGAPAPAAEPALVTLETVRAKLTAISQAGKKTEVAALIAEFGAAQLTKVKPEDYAALLAKAEAL
jgi:hypothetical protein